MKKQKTLEKMKKTFLLLFGLVSALCANADHDITVYSWSSPNGTVVETGGEVAYANGTTTLVNSQDLVNFPQEVGYGETAKTYHTLKVTGKYGNMYSTSKMEACGYFKFTLDENLQKDDKVVITAFRCNPTESKTASFHVLFNTAKITSSNYNTASKISAGKEGGSYWPNLYADADIDDYDNDGNDPKSYTITVTSSMAGSNIFYVTRKLSNSILYITSLKVVRSVSDEDYAASYPETQEISCQAGYINTFCYPFTTTASGATFYKLLGQKDGYVYGEKVAEGSSLTAGFPYLYVPTGSNITINRTNMDEEMVAASSSNGLYGNYSDSKQIKNGSTAEYMIFNADGLVFATDMNYNTVKQYGCYVKYSELTKLTESQSAKASKLFTVDTDEVESSTVTGIADVQKASLTAPMYSISGQRLGSLQKGQIYIMNGKKYIAK